MQVVRQLLSVDVQRSTFNRDGARCTAELYATELKRKELVTSVIIDPIDFVFPSMSELQ